MLVGECGSDTREFFHLIAVTLKMKYLDVLNILGVTDALKQHSKLLHPFYCNKNKEELTANHSPYNVYYEFFTILFTILLDTIRKLFHGIKYSEMDKIPEARKNKPSCFYRLP